MAKEATRIQNGGVVDYIAGATIANGDVIPLTARIGVANDDAVSGDTISLEIEGVFEIAATEATAFAFGEVVYFSASTRLITDVDTDTLAGTAVSAKAGATAGSIFVKIG